MLKYYMKEMFEPTLLYSFTLVILGIAASAYYGHFSLLYSVLVLIGSVLAQISVNVISDYFDYSSGLDKELARKKSGELSGGSSLLANGLIKPGYTLAVGLIALFFAAIIGLYFVYLQIQILPIIIIASVTIVTYSKYVKKIPYLPEPLCTFNYTLFSIGTFAVISGVSSLSYALIFSFLPAGIILGGNALFVNEVPDKVIDGKHGVRHSAVMLKTGKRIGPYYLVWQLVGFAILSIGAIMKILPIWSLSALVTFPVTIYVFNGLYDEDSKRYSSYLKLHTIAAVAFGIILSASYILKLL